MSGLELKAPKPDWLRVKLAGGERYAGLKQQFRELGLATVCEEAHCPNIGECWSEGTATIMILGDVCTRGCRFCAVKSGNPKGVTDTAEPINTAKALAAMDLAYVVLTMVDRDDIPDGGAAHVAETVSEIHARCPDMLVETLLGDFQGNLDDVATVIRDGRPDVFAHNVEVVPRLQRRIRDARCSWDRSIAVLEGAKEAGAAVTKSSIMVGIGETEEEVYDALEALRDADVDVVTLGQYLRPSKKYAPVDRYVEPVEFDRYKEAGLAMGFRFVAAGPLVRSSYRAAEAFMTGMLRRSTPPGQADTGRPRPSSTPDLTPPAMDRYGKKHLAVLR